MLIDSPPMHPNHATRLLAFCLALAAACASRTTATPAADSAGAHAGVRSGDAERNTLVATPPTAPGKVDTYRFPAAALGVDKDVVVWLPAGYEASTKRYPVIYLLHGLGGSETDFVELGGLAATADALGLEAIVVMPDGDAHFYINAAAPTDYDACMKERRGIFGPQTPESFCVRSPRYEDYMTQDLVGFVDSTFRTIAERNGRGLAGFSMGGFGALMLAMRHPDLYAAAASHAGVAALLYAGPWPYDAAKATVTDDVSHWGENSGAMGAWIRGLFGHDVSNWRAHDPAFIAQRLEKGALALYLDAGDADDFRLDAGAHHLHEVLGKAGVKHAFTIVPGGRHNLAYIRSRLGDGLAFLAKQLAPAR
jgi:S-formylglutathione hydrolase FrmB